VWLQRIGMGHSFPWFLDSALCIGVILHGILNSKPEFNSMFSFPEIFGKEVRLDFIYLLAGYYSYVAGLGLVPYRVFYAMAAIGFISCAMRILYRRSREKGEPRFGRKKRSHRHWGRVKSIRILEDILYKHLWWEVSWNEHSVSADNKPAIFEGKWSC